jgi:hypothetical protein
VTAQVMSGPHYHKHFDLCFYDGGFCLAKTL